MTETFKVLRPHLGDKMYNVGDKRIADRATVKHLIDKGVLSGGEPPKTSVLLDERDIATAVAEALKLARIEFDAEKSQAVSEAVAAANAVSRDTFEAEKAAAVAEALKLARDKFEAERSEAVVDDLEKTGEAKAEPEAKDKADAKPKNKAGE